MVQLTNYTLISNDGKEIIVDGNLVREYAPGLAEQFRSGFKEAAGKLTAPYFDGQSLQNFKTLLEQAAKKEVALRSYNDLVSAGTHAEVELAPFRDYVGPGPKEQKVLDYQTTELMKGIYQVKAKVYEYAAQLKDEIEKLPEISEHFLYLFNEAVKWKVPYILELALAQFAAEHIDIKDGYTELKDLDPRAQLFYLYLHEADFSVESIVDLYKWIVELSELDATKAIQSNKELYNDIIEKLVTFTAQNIQAILAKHPHFKSLFEKLEFKKMGELLRAELIKKDSSFFTTTIRPGKRSIYTPSTPFLSNLGNDTIALHDSNPMQNIYNYKTNTFKSMSLISSYNESYRYVLWGSDKLILYKYQETNIGIYSIKTGKRITDLPLRTMVSDVLPVTSHQFLIIGSSVDQGGHRYRLLKVTSENDSHYAITTQFAQENWMGGMVVNDHEFILFDMDTESIRLSLSNISNDFVKQIIIPDLNNYRFNTYRKINDTELGIIMMQNARSAALKSIIVSLPNLKVISQTDFSYPYKIIPGNYRFTHLDADYVIVKEYLLNGHYMHLYNLKSEVNTPLNNLNNAIVLDKNHIAAFDRVTDNFIIRFITQTSNLAEILDEIQKKNAQQQPSQPQPASKRPASPIKEQPIPAAAKGLKPEAREAKRPREEKEKPNS